MKAGGKFCASRKTFPDTQVIGDFNSCLLSICLKSKISLFGVFFRVAAGDPDEGDAAVCIQCVNVDKNFLSRNRDRFEYRRVGEGPHRNEGERFWKNDAFKLLTAVKYVRGQCIY